MNYAALGTGAVGRAIASRLAELGNEVTIGTRDPDSTLTRTAPDGMGNLPYAAWAAEHSEITLASFTGAARRAEVVVNATSGSASLDALALAGAENLAGKVLIDIANPLDFSRGMPPTLSVKDTDSLAEQIQRAFPHARVVKTLNTLTARLMVHPGELPEGSTVFLSGDDPQAKATVWRLLREFGHTDIIDLGELSTARGTEMLLPVWLRLWGALGTPMFNFSIVR